MLLYLSELQDNPQVFLVYLAAFAVAIFTGLAFHEFCHAWSANELGDDTARRRGRLTLNPLKHLDPIGTAMILIIGFGFAKPTPVNPFRLKYGPIKGNALVAFAGPASNFFFASVAAIPLRTGLVDSDFGSISAIIRFGSGGDYLWLFLYFIVGLNIVLGLFNLLPIPPLDGFSVLQGLVPRPVALQLEQIKPWGPGILMSLIVIGFLVPQYSPIGFLIGGINETIFDLLV